MSQVQTSSSFPSTDWSNLDRLNSSEFAEAISTLCQRYWYPVYAFVRQRCGEADRAEDLTQAFFTKVLDKQMFRAADPEKGRFRSYLLTSVRNFLASDHVAQQTLRRGGKTHVLSIDFMTAEQLYHGNRSASTDVASPADEFDRAWAVTLLERAIDRLRLEYDAKQQTRRFELLVPSLRSVELDYDAIADTLEVTPTAVRKAASRFRQRYGQLLREEVSATLSSEGDTDEEISWMIGLFAK